MNRTNHHSKWATTCGKPEPRQTRGRGAKSKLHYELKRGEAGTFVSATLTALEEKLRRIELGEYTQKL